MFFPERISQIRKHDRVLEIGPGGNPHPRSDVLLERAFDEVEASMQRGGTSGLVTKKPVVYYDGKQFPFSDGSFDYVICSHVIEHVEDVDAFCGEIFRVARRGYFEFPTIYYEYIYNFPVHKQLVTYVRGELRHLEKSATNLADFLPIHDLFHRSLAQGYSDLIDDMKHVMFQGFEWNEPFRVRRVEGIAELAADPRTQIPALPRVTRLMRRLLRGLLPVSKPCSE